MKSIISGKTEDAIYAAKTFNNNLQRVCDEEFEKIWDVVQKDIKEEFKDVSKDALRDYLFDYIYNSEHEETFEEYLDKYSKILKD